MIFFFFAGSWWILHQLRRCHKPI